MTRTTATALNQSISSQRLPLVVRSMCIMHHLRTQFESLPSFLNPRVGPAILSGPWGKLPLGQRDALSFGVLVDLISRCVAAFVADTSG
jgi:hypothetical protein